MSVSASRATFMLVSGYTFLSSWDIALVYVSSWVVSTSLATTTLSYTSKKILHPAFTLSTLESTGYAWVLNRPSHVKISGDYSTCLDIWILDVICLCNKLPTVALSVLLIYLEAIVSSFPLVLTRKKNKEIWTTNFF